MSIRSDVAPSAASLRSAEGELVCVRVTVEPRLLEELLEALAHVPFPINPQIYHHAGIGYLYADGRQEIHPVTLVEFPAYASRLEEVREVLKRRGFDAASVRVKSMLENIHSNCDMEPAPKGMPYRQVTLYKQMVSDWGD